MEKWGAELREEKKEDDFIEEKIRKVRKERNRERLLPSRGEPSRKRQKMEEGISMRSIWRSCPVRRSLVKEGEDQNPPSKKRKKDNTEESEDEEERRESNLMEGEKPATAVSNLREGETEKREEKDDFPDTDWEEAIAQHQAGVVGDAQDIVTELTPQGVGSSSSSSGLLSDSNESSVGRLSNVEDDLLEILETDETRIDEMELISKAVNDTTVVENQTVNDKPPAELTVVFKTASELLVSRPPLLSIGCPLLDLALGGGLRRGCLTEVVGESSAGKTQFCLQCALATASKGEKVVYIVTEGTFPQARLDQMVQARQREDLRDLVLVQQVKDVHHLLNVLGSQLCSVVCEVGLVIVDSVAALVRYDGEYTTGLARGGVVHQLGQAVLEVALTHKVAVLAVNQVASYIEGSRVNCFSWGRSVVASLGLAWTQYPHTRLWLTKTRLVINKTASPLLSGLVVETRLRTMHVDWSCRLGNSTTHFIVEPRGCRGVRVIDDRKLRFDKNCNSLASNNVL